MSLDTTLDAEPWSLLIGPAFRYTVDISRGNGWRFGHHISSGLSCTALDRHINGGVVHMTAGFGARF